MNDSFVSSNQNTEIDSINSYFECITECSIVDGNSNGELSEIDMLRILEKISSNDLNQCELTCDSEQV